MNDTLGHPFGDLLLQAVRPTGCAACCASMTPVARLGGDEFAILQSDVTQPEQVSERWPSGCSKSSATLYELEGQPRIRVGASIGIALAPGDATDPETERCSRTPIWRSTGPSEAGKGTFRFFEAEMDARVQKRLRLEMDLRLRPLQTNELKVYYQPIVDLTSGGVTGFEALIRWPHAERGMIPPTEFIPVAEEMGLIAQIGAFVLDRACTDAAGGGPIMSKSRSISRPCSSATAICSPLS